MAPNQPGPSLPGVEVASSPHHPIHLCGEGLEGIGSSVAHDRPIPFKSSHRVGEKSKHMLMMVWSYTSLFHVGRYSVSKEELSGTGLDIYIYIYQGRNG